MLFRSLEFSFAECFLSCRSHSYRDVSERGCYSYLKTMQTSENGFRVITVGGPSSIKSAPATQSLSPYPPSWLLRTTRRRRPDARSMMQHHGLYSENGRSFIRNPPLSCVSRPSRKRMGAAGFEPATVWSEAKRSVQAELSARDGRTYGPSQL